MLRNILTIFFRLLWQQKAASLLNLAGLALGLAGSLILLLFVRHEWQFDRFHEHGHRIYRVLFQRSSGDATERLATTMPALAPALASEVAGVERAVRLRRVERRLIWQHAGRQFYREAGLYADTGFFDLFSFTLLHGDPAAALASPYNLVITAGLAQKLFGDTEVVGRLLDDAASGKSYLITGVLGPIPPASHLQFDYLLAYATLQSEGQLADWQHTDVLTYLRLRDGAAATGVQAGLQPLLDKYLGSLARDQSLHLQALHDIHLRSSHLASDLAVRGNAATVGLFAVTAVLVLLIASMNFVNLATARSVRRAREVGMRKVVGAYRSQLLWQFLVEALLFSAAAVGLAVGLVELLLPRFNAFMATRLQLDLFGDPLALPALFAIAAVVALLAGLYPALFLSGYQPATVLKGTLVPGAGPQRLRRLLVLLQFAVSLLFIIGAATIHAQLAFLRERDPGFALHDLALLPLGRDFAGPIQPFLHQLRQQPHILQATISSQVPGEELVLIPVNAEPGDGRTGTGRRPLLAPVAVDEHFLATYGIDLIAGRNFSREFAADASQRAGSFIVSRTAANRCGWDEPLQKQLSFAGRSGKVIGVIDDVQFVDQRQPPAPLLLYFDPGGGSTITLRFDTERTADAIAASRQAWQPFFPALPFDFEFLDVVYNRQFRNDERLGVLYGTFALLAIAIAALGLLGMAGHTAAQRTREIGVRKLLGASTPGIIWLLTRDVTRWVLWANLLAWPLAHWLLRGWLQQFAHRIAMPYGLFGAASLALLLLAALAVALRAYRAAQAKPAALFRTL